MKRMISLLHGFVCDGQIKEHELFGDIMAEDTANSFLNDFAQTKQGNDTIFSCWARYQEAIAQGHDAVNGTIGSSLKMMAALQLTRQLTSLFVTHRQ